MTEGIKKNEKSGRAVYPDIIDLPHHQSPTRPHMSLYDRAAQFAPFAALTGYEDMVSEEARETGVRIELEDWEKEQISQKLSLISDAIEDGQNPVITITHFVADKHKVGGEYVSVTEEIKKVDTIFHKVILMRTEGIGKQNVEIEIENIIGIRGELVDHLDDNNW
ncbi:MAG: hypothetical protein IJ794_13200 [Lachnospiraceae bacterium]|nr:hypothetical protein [Lachnospiraceae bacterium]